MVALLSKFRKGDRVRVDARDEFYAFIDGQRAIVSAIGPAEANTVHSQVPGGYCAVCDAEGRVFLVPHDQLAFDL
ncbi:hypothetical protein PWR66_07665 [Paraburkholderia sp. A1RO-5]|uniref:hypothetical protein n=1 Tax=Paraburkholderia sp. A1RO-5 TaxID=3028369 RepID=UPI003B79B3D1